VAVVLVLVATASASAHALLLESTPKADTAVTAPSQIVLRFNGRIETRLSAVTLIGGPRQTRIFLVKPRASDRPDVLIYPIPLREPGRYRLEWKALSVDGHLTDGSFSFDIVAPDAPSTTRQR